MVYIVPLKAFTFKRLLRGEVSSELDGTRGQGAGVERARGTWQQRVVAERGSTQDGEGECLPA